MAPTSVCLRLELPSSAATVAQLSCASCGRASTSFRYNQDTRAFPPEHRFLIARLQSELLQPDHGLKAGGYSTDVGLVPALALAPCMRLSPHTAPTSRFPRAGGPWAWRLAASGSIALRVWYRVAVVGVAARRCTRHMHRWAAEPARERLPHSVTLLSPDAW